MPQNLKNWNINPPLMYLDMKFDLKAGLVSSIFFIWALLWLSLGTFSFLSGLQEKRLEKSPQLAKFQNLRKTHSKLVNAQNKHVIHHLEGDVGIKKWSPFFFLLHPKVGWGGGSFSM